MVEYWLWIHDGAALRRTTAVRVTVLVVNGDAGNYYFVDNVP